MTLLISFFFFFNDTATTEIYTLSLHDALPICIVAGRADEVERGLDLYAAVLRRHRQIAFVEEARDRKRRSRAEDRKSTRLNSSHTVISYAVFCLKKKKTYSWFKGKVIVDGWKY